MLHPFACTWLKNYTTKDVPKVNQNNIYHVSLSNRKCLVLAKETLDQDNGNDGASITSPKDIANEHAVAFADNSSSAHYNTKFQTIKAHDERDRIDITSNNTEVYNKPFRLRDLRRSTLKVKPRAPAPDGMDNNLLKHLPDDTLNILKEILNNIWISGDFPPQWRAANVIPIPKPNKDHTNPLSYRPIAL